MIELNGRKNLIAYLALLFLILTHLIHSSVSIGKVQQRVEDDHRILLMLVDKSMGNGR